MLFIKALITTTLFYRSLTIKGFKKAGTLYGNLALLQENVYRYWCMWPGSIYLVFVAFSPILARQSITTVVNVIT